MCGAFDQFVNAATCIDFQVIASRRISREDGEVLLRAQDEQAAHDDSAREAATAAAIERNDATERGDKAAWRRKKSAQRVDVEV